MSLKPFSKFLTGLAFAGLSLVLPQLGQAATFHVKPFSDANCMPDFDCTLAAALAVAQQNNQDDTIEISPNQSPYLSQTISYTAAQNENFSLTVRGLGNASPVLRGNAQDPILIINIGQAAASAQILIENLVFENGGTNGTGSALLINGAHAKVLINDSKFDGNGTSFAGSGLVIWSIDSKIALNENRFVNNLGDCFGGAVAIFSTNSDVSFYGNQFVNNSLDGVLNNNQLCSSQGGAVNIRLTGAGNVSLQENFFENNSAKFGGAAYVFNQSGGISAYSNVFNENYATEAGAGLYIEQWNAASTQSIISQNAFLKNISFGDGGGLFLSMNDDVLLLDNRFTENEAANRGGGAIVYSVEKLDITQNLFSQNKAIYGGGMHAYLPGQGASSFQHNNFYKNKSMQPGGGLFLSPTVGSNTSVLNNLFFENTSVISGSDLFVKDQIQSSVLLSHNLMADFDTNHVSDPQNPIPNEMDLVLVSNINGDPLFVDAEAGNFHLKAGSPCIHAGLDQALNLTPLDLDGQTRPVGTHVDIGMDEFVGCGDGVIDQNSGESCDDGNLIDTDDCLNTCKLQIWPEPPSSDPVPMPDPGPGVPDEPSEPSEPDAPLPESPDSPSTQNDGGCALSSQSSFTSSIFLLAFPMILGLIRLRRSQS